MKITDSKTRAQWIEAIRRELKSIVEHTFNLDGQPLPGEQIIPLMFIFKAKINSLGGLDKLKARLCARGDLQNTEGEDIFSPTASMRLLKMFLALGVEVGRQVKQLDFISAFIQGKVRSRIFVFLDEIVGEVCPEFSKFVGRPLLLERALYGLATSGKYWYEDLDEYLQLIGFRKSTVDPCFYSRKTKAGILRLINYVDDTLYFGTTDESEEEFVKELRNRFNFNLLGTASWYLGIKINYNKLGATIDQQLYAKSIVNKLVKKGTDIYPRNTPLQPDITLTKRDCPTTPAIQQEIDAKYSSIHFRSVIGALIYLSSGTRPDITFATVKLAKYAHAPGENHYKALTWLLGYIQKFPNKAI